MSKMPDSGEMTSKQLERLGMTRDQFEKKLKDKRAREKSVTPIGAMAPDFEIKRLSENGKLTKESVRLSAFRGRPVALVFGSYT